MIDWTEKYRPKTLADVVGNSKPVATLKQWAEEWDKGVPKKKAALLYGDAGIGKTSSAYALANDMGWGVIELNASDQRNYDIIKKIAFRGATSETFTDSGNFVSSKFGGRKLIILDEADSLFGSEDRGGLQAIVETIRAAKQPIILIMNDYYSTRRKAPALQNLAEVIRYSRLRQDSIVTALKRICAREGIEASKEALSAIAEKASGDMRSAINDLQALAIGIGSLDVADSARLGYRDVKDTMFDAIAHIFKTTQCEEARSALKNLDEDPEMILLWLDENLPAEYSQPGDLSRGYDALSKSDIFLSRVMKRQHYRLWSYALDLMSAGVAMAKEKPYHKYTSYQFPKWLMKMSTSRGSRTTKANLSKKIGELQHTSANYVRSAVLPLFKLIFQNDRRFAASMTIALELTEDEVAFLMDEKVGGRRTKYVFEDAKKLYESASGKESGATQPINDSFEAPESASEGESNKERDSSEAPSDSQRSLLDF